MRPPALLTGAALLLLGGAAAFFLLGPDVSVEPDPVEFAPTPPLPRPKPKEETPAPPKASETLRTPAIVRAVTLVTGRVVARSGGVLGGATVLAFPREGDEPLSFTADDGGRFTVKGPPGRVAEMMVSAEGYASRLFEKVPQGTDLLVTLEASVGFRGIVKALGGGPIGQATVRIAPRGRADLHEIETGTADDGRFFFANVAPGSWDVSVLSEDHAPFHEAGLTIPAPDGLEKEYLLLPGLTLSGRVVAANGGQPLVGAQVQIIDRLVRGHPVPHQSRTLGPYLTNSDGVYEISGLGPGAIRLIARCRGFASRVMDHTIKSIQKGGRRVDIPLLAGVPLTGTVTDPQGRPAAGARVVIRPAGKHVSFAAFAVAAPFLFHAEAWKDDVGEQWPMIRADDRGRFEIPGLGVGIQGQLQAVDPERRWAPSSNTYVVVKQGLAPVALRLRPSAEISGTVTDPEGRPIGDAVVFADGSRVLTSRDGAFALTGVPETANRLTVRHPQYESHDRDLKGQPRVGLHVVLDAGSIVRGTVTDVRGQPLIGATVMVFTSSKSRPAHRFLRSVRTELDGTFQASGFRAKHVDLLVDMAGFARHEAKDVIPDPRPLSIELREKTWEPGGNAFGAVIDHVTQHPIISFTVEGMDPTMVQQLEGRFLLQNLPAGLHRLTVASAGHQSVDLRLEIQPEKTIEVPVVRMHRGYRLKLLVGHGPKKLPLRVAPSEVHLRELAGQQNPAWALVAQRGVGNQLVFPSLRTGPYELTIRKKGFRPDASRVEVRRPGITHPRLLFPQ